MLKQRSIAIFVGIVCISLLSACQTVQDPIANYRENTAEELYEGASHALESSNFDTAVKQYEALEILYPVNSYAEQAHLNIIYAYYRTGDTSAVAASADRYLRMYPRSIGVSYVFYMKAIANAQHQRSIMQKWFSPDRSQRDLTMAKQAYLDFKRIVDYYPDSPYAEESRRRMRMLYDTLAKYELDAARYYVNRGAYVAAINRVAYMLDVYPQAKQTANGLALMVESYNALGLAEKAQQTLDILALNFEDYPDVPALRAELPYDAIPQV